ncbi:MAG: MFS transporter [Caulobacterales bacterium]
MPDEAVAGVQPYKLTRDDVLRWLALLGLSIPIYATMTLSPLLNGAAMDRLQINTFEIGLIRTLEILANAALTIGLAPRLARFESKRLGLIGAAGVTLGAALSAIAADPFWLLGARLIAGIGAGLTQCAIAVLMAETRSPQRVGGSLMIPITTCSIIAALVGGRFAQSDGLFGIFIILAAACAAGFALAYLGPRSPAELRKAHAVQGPSTSLGALKSPYVLAAAIVFVGSSASWAFFERKGRSLGLEPTDISNLIALAALSAGLFGSLSVLIKDRWILPAGIAGTVLFTLAAASVPAAAATTLFSAAYVVQIIAFALTSNLLTAIGVRLDPSGGLAAAGRGWSTLLNAAAPAMGGALVLWGGFTPLSYLCLAAGAAAVLFLRRSRKLAPY